MESGNTWGKRGEGITRLKTQMRKSSRDRPKKLEKSGDDDSDKDAEGLTDEKDDEHAAKFGAKNVITEDVGAGSVKVALKDIVPETARASVIDEDDYNEEEDDEVTVSFDVLTV